MGDLRAPLGSERIEERLQRRLGLPGRGPDQASGGMVDHHHQIQPSATVGDLVDADPCEPVEPVDQVLDVGPDPGDDRAHGAPGDPHQLGHRALGGLRRQPRHGLVEGVGMPGAVPRPRHMGHHHTVLATLHPRRVGLEPGLDHAQVQRPPPTTHTPALVIAAAAT
jgi:hypothetical protein